MNEEPNNQIDSTSELIELPEDAVSVSQVEWAWLWSATPWLIVVGILSTLSLEPVFAAVIVLIIVVPRFLTWRRTAYIVTDDALIYQRGGFTGSRQYNIPMANLVEVKSRNGMFGRGLGYQAVDIVLDNQTSASLAYVPTVVGLESIIRERMERFQKDNVSGSDVEDQGSDQITQSKTITPSSSTSDGAQDRDSGEQSS